MFAIGPVAFLTPWLLLGLLFLPVLWWLLRAIPPRPARRAFPGVRLLLGLSDPERMPERTPLWLLLLRVAAVAAAILAFAEPVLNRQDHAPGAGPLLVVMDGGWSSAPNWAERQKRAREFLLGAAANGRTAALMLLTDRIPAGGRITWRDPKQEVERTAVVRPKPWQPDRAGFGDWIAGLGDEEFETIWLTDGLDHGGAEALVTALAERGPVSVVLTSGPFPALKSVRLKDGKLVATYLRPEAGQAATVAVNALGPDPNGVERILGRGEAVIEPEAKTTEVEIDMPIEARNRVSRLEIAGVHSAGAVLLADDAVRRRKVALIAGRKPEEGEELVSPLFYLRKALEPSAEIIEAPLAETLHAAPDVLILADVGTMTEKESEAVKDWVDRGGLLLRFAGPRLARSGVGQLNDDPLLPVRLRAGGRSIGGAMSWGEPKRLTDFRPESPFSGLPVPGDVEIAKQVMAQPDPDLPSRVLATLEDGTPLVTGRKLGDGQVVLFHVTANAEWSNLPLSGLFVQMLERLAVSARGTAPGAVELAGRKWRPERVLTGFGELEKTDALPVVAGEDLVEFRPGPETPPGLYRSGSRQVAFNALGPGDVLEPLGNLPPGVEIITDGPQPEAALKPLLLALALVLLAADVFATIALSGRLARGVTAALVPVLVFFMPAPDAVAQSGDGTAILAANNTVLAYVETGDRRTDRMSLAGLRGLTRTLNRRTAVEPVEPVGVSLETDELALFPFLYWPVNDAQRMPSEAAYARLNDYLRTGGMILFDTQDAGLGASSGADTPNRRMLRKIAAPLDIPPLEPIPPDHVLTRTFYLLKGFPGRHARGTVWVEASPDAKEVEGLPFRNLNDGVTPVIFGSNDWAAAWAIGSDGEFLYPVGRGRGGERQREMALRFGVNLIMYVLTGNYKSDQVHVPALLERLGQ
ncbi:MAG: DUF4159 domain-containing protein, partial [Paracoccaceae bacterium]